MKKNEKLYHTIVSGAEPWSAEGNRLGVLVLHGFTGSPASVKPWGQALAAEGWTIRVPRLPGHGTTWQEMNQTTWEDWYAEAERNFRELQERCNRVFVMGLSMGGALSLRLAEEHGDAISGIVLVNPAVHTTRLIRILLPLVKLIIPSGPGLSNDIAKPGQDEIAYDKVPLKAAHSLSKLLSIIKSDIGKVTQPLLLFRSIHDHVVAPSNAAFILANAASSDIHEAILPDSYHVATLDYDSEVIVRDSISFVRRLAA